MAKAAKKKSRTKKKKKQGKRSPLRKDRVGQYRAPSYVALTQTLARNVRAARARLGLTQEQAAEACGLAARHLQRIEAGTENSTFTTLARLSDGLATPASDLLRQG
jgi:ribosome-binding protein aMBF1 (putative translation factor)